MTHFLSVYSPSVAFAPQPYPNFAIRPPGKGHVPLSRNFSIQSPDGGRLTRLGRMAFWRVVARGLFVALDSLELGNWRKPPQLTQVRNGHYKEDLEKTHDSTKLLNKTCDTPLDFLPFYLRTYQRWGMRRWPELTHNPWILVF